MSTSNIVSLRLDHLAQAAQLLATSSFAVSGFLRTAQHRLATGEGRDLSTPTHLRLCKTCGTQLILGWNCELSDQISAKKKKKRTRQDRIQKQEEAKPINVRCSRCDRTTTVESFKSTNNSKSKGDRRVPVTVLPAKPSSTEVMKMSEAQPRETSHAIPTAKKRNRNKNTSLQSMLDSRKPSAPSKGFGLGLADFMVG